MRRVSLRLHQRRPRKQFGAPDPSDRAPTGFCAADVDSGGKGIGLHQVRTGGGRTRGQSGRGPDRRSGDHGDPRRVRFDQRPRPTPNVQVASDLGAEGRPQGGPGPERATGDVRSTVVHGQHHRHLRGDGDRRGFHIHRRGERHHPARQPGPDGVTRGRRAGHRRRRSSCPFGYRNRGSFRRRGKGPRRRSHHLGLVCPRYARGPAFSRGRPGTPRMACPREPDGHRRGEGDGQPRPSVCEHTSGGQDTERAHPGCRCPSRRPGRVGGEARRHPEPPRRRGGELGTGERPLR